MAAYHLMGTGGAVFTFEDPLPDHIAKQWAKGDLVRVEADGSPADEPFPPEDDDEDEVLAAPEDGSEDGEEAEDERPVRKPNTAASKADWVAWAVSQGMPEDEAESMTRMALIEQFHNREQ